MSHLPNQDVCDCGQQMTQEPCDQTLVWFCAACQAYGDEVEMEDDLADLRAAEKDWRAAVSKFQAAIQASIKADAGKPHNPYWDPYDAQHLPITEAGRECHRAYEAMCDIRERLGMPREPQDER